MWGAASVMAKGADHVDGLTLAFHRLWVGALAMFVIFTLRGGFPTDSGWLTIFGNVRWVMSNAIWV